MLCEDGHAHHDASQSLITAMVSVEHAHDRYYAGDDDDCFAFLFLCET